MKNYFVPIIIAAALTISVAVISKRAQAQNTSARPKDKTAAVMANPALANTEPTPKDAVFVTEIPAGYRDWKVVSVAHEAGDLNDIRAILGERHSDQGVPGEQASVSGRCNRWPNRLELCPV